MKAYITINQQALSQIKNIDLIDATIFRYIFDFSVSGNANKIVENNHIYIWVSYQKIIDDNPLLGIKNKRAIEKRVKKLVDNNLLDKKIYKELGNKTYFSITQFAYDLTIENKGVCTPECKGVCTQECKGVCTPECNNRELLDRELLDNPPKSPKGLDESNQPIEANQHPEVSSHKQQPQTTPKQPRTSNKPKKAGSKEITLNGGAAKLLDKLEDELDRCFGENKILAQKKKINMSVVKKDFANYELTINEEQVQDIIDKYPSYVKRNKNFAKRLNLYILAYLENSLDDLEYKATKEEAPQNGYTQSYDYIDGIKVVRHTHGA